MALRLLVGALGLGGVLPEQAHALCTVDEIGTVEPGCRTPSAPCIVSRRLVVDDGCVLDFGDRDVTLATNGTLDIGGGTASLRARSLTVGSGGLIDGTPEGGMILIHVAGNVVVEPSAARGIDVTGDPSGGVVQIDAGGDVVLNGHVRVGNAPQRLTASGGTLVVRARGHVVVGPNSAVDASGGSSGCGGSIDLAALGSIEIQRAIDAAGLDGGTISVDAGGDVITGGALLNNARNGGNGGCIEIGGNGNVTVGAAVESRGSGLGSGNGCGGLVSVASRTGDVILRADINVRGGDAEGAGGSIELSGRSVLIQSGALIAEGASTFSCGGLICVDARQDVVLDGRLAASGAEFGGEIELTATRDVTINGTVDARSRGAGSTGGSILVNAGRHGGGNVAVNAKLDATAPRCATECSDGGSIDVTGCDVVVNVIRSAPGAPVLDATAPGTGGTGGDIFLAARRQLVQQGRLDASGGPETGSVTLVHPSRRPPLLAAPPTVAPAPTIRSCDEASCTSGVCSLLCAELCDCGNGSIEQFEECDGARAGCDVVAGEVCGAPGSALGCACIDTCGNGRIDLGEDCEPGLSGDDCRTRGFAGGTGGCRECAFDESGCDPGTCGDGIVAPRAGEVCEPSDLAGRTCASLGFTRGSLACASGCGSFDTSGCARGFCGDGGLDPGEECDAGAGNSNLPDAPCRPDCRAPRCGDGIPDATRGEECDDGNSRADDVCLPECKRAICGDGIVCSAPGCATGPGGRAEECDGAAICCLSTCGRRACADGLPCGDQGGNGCCHPDEACDDGDPCTAEECNRLAGCAHRPVPECCRGDGDCDDADPCTDDGCDLARNACVFVPNAAACDDGNACTVNDACRGGACAGAPISCPSPGICLAPAGCDPVRGCRFDRIAGCCETAAECADGNVCTEERCDGTTNRCVIERRGGADGLDCLVSQEVAALQGSVDAQATALGRKLAKQLRKLATKARTRIEKGRDRADRPTKAEMQLRKADTLFGSFGAKVAKARAGGKIDAAIAAELLAQAEAIRAVLTLVAGDLETG